MKSSKFYLGAFVLALALAAGSASGQVNLLSNGDFESDPLGLGKTTLLGWTVTAGTIDIVPLDSSPAWGLVPSGNRYLELTGTPGAATVFTSLVTIPTVQYDFSGFIATHLGISGATARMDVFLNGVFATQITHSLPWVAFDPQWEVFHFNFVATNLTTVLELRDVTGLYSFGGVLLDALSVAPVQIGAVPEPATYGLVMGGVLVLLATVATWKRSRVTVGN